MIVINGKSYQGSSVTIINDTIIIDGVKQDEGLSGIVKVEISGDPVSIKCDKSVTVNGNVHGDVDAMGSVSCGNVGGNVDAGGSVSCGNVGGDIDAGGSVSARK